MNLAFFKKLFGLLKYGLEFQPLYHLQPYDFSDFAI